MIRSSIDGNFQQASDGTWIVYIDRHRKPGHMVATAADKLRLERPLKLAYWALYGSLIPGMLINLLLIFLGLALHYYFLNEARNIATTFPVSSRAYDRKEARLKVWATSPPAIHWSLIVSGIGMIVLTLILIIYAHLTGHRLFSFVFFPLPFMGLVGITLGLYGRHKRKESNHSLQARRP